MKEIGTVRTRVEETIHRLYDNSPFIRLCGIELAGFGCGVHSIV